MISGSDSRLDALLDDIEDIERRSLAAGDVEGSLSLDEVLELAEARFGDDAEAAIEAMIEAVLLHPVSAARGEERYRSRFAEATRLLVRNRQVFSGEAWLAAPPLVADFRIDMRRRRYPRRNLPSGAVFDQITGLTALQRQVWDAIAPDELAGFQGRAASLLSATTVDDRAAIVTAGTGSGKTLAFYLPVFVSLVEEIEVGSAWTKAVAIYPRNELLKDQLSEAYRNAGRCAGPIAAAKGRPLRLAAFYGDTPWDASESSLSRAWAPRGADRLCPFLRCGCGGEMHWKRADLDARREVLTCASCGDMTNEDRLSLTRTAALRDPPDILFTTTEMLNRSISNTRRWPLFGLGRAAARRPRFILLDEAHTYDGVSGAQAALTLRRWRAFHGGPLTWIGLSATLAEAPRFFSQLTGVPPLDVVEITPTEAEMFEEGREYQVALRGDPASRTSLLSTSIQTLMLLGRIMDSDGAKSVGRFGRRVFAFTDDLDVVQRLHDDFRDAEAYTLFGRPDGLREPLAAMRGPLLPGETAAQRRQRDLAGQRWAVAETIGRPVRRRLVIGRTTSRDPGVDGRADVIVATSALEVGFNDTTVGAVLQHKAPRNFASFLQRRGRAGRNRLMRPLTVTVLSDYGRDRQLFQGFEHLFDPALDRQTLPVQNQYILRMQAAFALLDWCGSRLASAGLDAGSVWTRASQPSKTPREAQQAGHLRDLLGRLSRGEEGLVHDLRHHLRAALAVPDDVVDRFLWQPPRAILLEAVPRLLSRLYRNWELAWPTAGRKLDMYSPDHPMPEFVPRALFAELNLPDVEFILPPTTAADDETFETLPIQQALAQFAPGRVSRRYGEGYGGLAHWFPVPAGVSACSVDVADYAEEREPLGSMSGQGPTGPVSRPVYRPWRVRLQKANDHVVKPTSNAQPVWASGFDGLGAPVTILPPLRTGWRHLVDRVDLYLQRHRASVGVRRFATGARAEVRRGQGVTQVVDVAFVDQDGPAALGFAFETDGLAVRMRLPAASELMLRTFAPDIERSLRTLRFRRFVQDDAELPVDCTSHERRWLREIYSLTVALRSIRRDQSLLDAASALAREGDPRMLDEAMDLWLGQQDARPASDDGNGSAAAGPAPDRLDRLRVGVAQRFATHGVPERLHVGLQAAFKRDLSWGEFVRNTLDATLTDALLAATTAATPAHSATDALIGDWENDPTQPQRTTIWLTETTVGGAGVLQSIAEAFTSEPRRLFAAVEAALEPGDLEAAADALARVYAIATEPEIATLIGQVRAEQGHGQRAAARSRLLAVLARRGLDVGRAFQVSLNTRLLSPDGDVRVDDVVRRLLILWTMFEDRLGMELDAREVAALATDDPELLDLAIMAHVFDHQAPSRDRTNALAALLWPKSSAVRRDSMLAYNRFRPSPDVEPAIIRALLLDTATLEISLTSPDWEVKTVGALASDAAVNVWTPLWQPELLRTALIRLPAVTVTLGHLVLYPSLERVTRGPDRLTATFVLKEQL